MSFFFQVAFLDVICEPPGAQSPLFSHQFNKAVYANTTHITYSFLTLLFGGLLSFAYGLLCGSLSFLFVWIGTPFVRFWLIPMGLAGKLWYDVVSCFYNPLYDSLGRCFSHVDVKFTQRTVAVHEV